MINVGMVGVGCISKIYLKNFKETFQNVRLIAVCDLIRERAEKAQKEYDIPKLYDTMEELLRFPGVGRKVANLLLGDLFHKGGMVTDTHCIRICGRLGMYPESLKDPTRIEKLLDPLVAPEERCDFCHRIVQFGRDVCTARAPRCGECPLADLCEHARSIKNT